MRRTVFTGVLLAVAGVLAVYIGSWLNLGLRATIFGASMGAVLGLVRDRSVGGRLAAFLIGVVVAWLGYALRAQFLPDVPAGEALALIVVVILVTAMAVLSGGRLPLWAGLLGAAALFGAYEELYVAAPYNFLSQSVIVVSSLLVPVAMGFLVGVVSATLWGADASDGAGWSEAPPDTPSSGLAILANDQESSTS
jgi:hypothetical protein